MIVSGGTSFDGPHTLCAVRPGYAATFTVGAGWDPVPGSDPAFSLGITIRVYESIYEGPGVYFGGTDDTPGLTDHEQPYALVRIAHNADPLGDRLPERGWSTYNPRVDGVLLDCSVTVETDERQGTTGNFDCSRLFGGTYGGPHPDDDVITLGATGTWITQAVDE